METQRQGRTSGLRHGAIGKLLAGVLAGFILVPLTTTACRPVTDLVVESGTDAPDANPGDGYCAAADNSCTLRAAVMEANLHPGLDSIDLAGTTSTISIAGMDEDQGATGDLDVTDDLVIHDGGIVMDPVDRTIDQHAGSLTLRDVIIVDQSFVDGPGRGAAIRHAGGALLLERTRLSDQREFFADSAAIDDAGAPAPAGPVTLVDSVIYQSRGPGIAAGPAPVTLLRSTIFNGFGPGLVLRGAHATVTNSTIGQNGGATGQVVGQSGATADFVATTIAGLDDSFVVLPAKELNGLGPTSTLKGSIVYARSTDLACDIPLVSLGSNAASDTTCGLLSAKDKQGLDVKLRAPSVSGGATPGLWTYQLKVGSPARDRAPIGLAGMCDGSLPTDERGVIRPQGSYCDAGAVEMQPNE